MRFDDAGHSLGAKIAHFHCVLKYFMKLVGGWEVVT